LKLKPKKCEFLRNEFSYLGHVISENGVLQEPSKTRVIEESPSPQNVKQLEISRPNELLSNFSHSGTTPKTTEERYSI